MLNLWDCIAVEIFTRQMPFMSPCQSSEGIIYVGVYTEIFLLLRTVKLLSVLTFCFLKKKSQKTRAADD